MSAAREGAFSPDGRSLAFVRAITNNSADLYVVTLDENITPQGDPRQLTDDMGDVCDPVWTPGGREIIFSAGPVGSPNLWRMDVSGRGQPERLASIGEGGISPALSRDGRRLVYSRSNVDINIWRVETTAQKEGEPRKASHIASSRIEYNPQFSPDGRRIAFESNRSGTSEIWVCDSDGSDCVQVTHAGGPLTGTPRWSPDGKQIALDSRPEGPSDVFVVGADGGTPRRLTTSPAGDWGPSWSRDGEWVYFVSNRSGSYQVWKIPAEGSDAPEEAIQVTRNGGTEAFESTDGKLVYYFRQDGVWQVPVGGGEETRVIGPVGFRSVFAVANEGIYLLDSFVPGASLQFLDLDTGKVKTITTIDRQPYSGLTVSPDGATILYSQMDHVTNDLMLVENFR